MKYFRCWKAHPEDLKKGGSDIGWHIIEKDKVLDLLSNGNPAKYDEIEFSLKNGSILQSEFAYYIGIKYC